MKKNKIISLALAAGILIGTLPIQAFAITGTSEVVTVPSNNSVIAKSNTSITDISGVVGNIAIPVPVIAGTLINGATVYFNNGINSPCVSIKRIVKVDDKYYIGVSLTEGSGVGYMNGTTYTCSLRALDYKIDITSATGVNYPIASGIWLNAVVLNDVSAAYTYFEIPKKLLDEGIKSVSVINKKMPYDINFYYNSTPLHNPQPEITTAYAGSKTLSSTLYIDMLEPTLDDYLEKVKANVLSIPSVNSLSQAQVLSYLKFGINSNTTVTIDNYNYKPSDDKVSGAYSGTVKVTNTAGSQTFNLNVLISQLPQSTVSAKIAIGNLVNTYVASNNSNKNDFISICKNLVGGNITVLIPDSDWKLEPASESIKGSLIGKVNISDGTTSDTVPISKSIDYLDQSIDTSQSKVKEAIDNLAPGNNVTEEQVLNIAKTSIDANYYDVKLDGFSNNNSTESTVGTIEGLITITDKNNSLNTRTVTVNKEIPILSQTLDNAYTIVSNILNNYSVNNSLTKGDVLTNINKSINTNYITSEVSQFDLVQATESAKGKLDITVKLTDKNNAANTKIASKSYIIEQVPQSLNTIKALYEKRLSDFVTTNVITDTDIIKSVNIPNVDVEASIIGFNVQNATDETKGSVKGTLNIKNKVTSELVQVPINLTINYLPQELSTAVKLVQNAIPTNAFNSTSFNGIVEAADSVITNPNIHVFADVDNPPKKVEATEFTPGTLTGTIIVSNGTTKVPVPVNLVIDKLPQTLVGTQTTLEAALKSFSVNNDTEETDVLNNLQTNITNPNLSISFGTTDVEKFNKVKASELVTGKIKGVIYVKEGATTLPVPVDLTIGKLPQNLISSKTDLEAALNSIVATNDTEETDVLSKLQTNITDPNLSISFGSADNEKFKKVNASEFVEGSIKGVINVTNGTDTIQVPVDLTIGKLPQTVDGAKTKILAYLDSMVVTNNTKAINILNNVKGNITNSSISIAFGIEDGETFKISKASESSGGLIEGLIYVSDNVNTAQVPVHLLIAKLPQSAESAKTLIESVIKSTIATNDTTKDKLLSDLSSAVAPNVIITFGTGIEDFTKIDATTSAPGKITGVIYINDGTTTTKIYLDMPISQLPLAPIVVTPTITAATTGGSGGSSGGSSSESTEISSQEQLSQILKSSDVSILGISRDNLLSNITMDVVNTTTENNNIAFEGVNSTITKVDFPYTEIKATDGKTTKGALGVLMAGNSVIGMSIQGTENYGENTDIMVSTKLSKENLSTYTKIKEIDKYVEVKDKSVETADGLVLQGINSDNYLITTKPILENKLADAGWNKNASNEWLYVNNYNTEKGWISDNGWYYSDLNTGKMKTGWIQNTDGTWYYLNANSDGSQGKMQTGWLKNTDGNWYYLNSNGSMAQDTYVDGYYLNQNGALV